MSLQCEYNATAMGENEAQSDDLREDVRAVHGKMNAAVSVQPKRVSQSVIGKVFNCSCGSMNLRFLTICVRHGRWPNRIFRLAAVS